MKMLFTAPLLTACCGCYTATPTPVQDIRGTFERNTVIINQQIALQDRLTANISRELFYENAGLGDIAPETTSELQSRIAAEEKELIARDKEPDVHACFTTNISKDTLTRAINAGQLTIGEVETNSELLRESTESAHALTKQATRYHAIHGYSH